MSIQEQEQSYEMQYNQRLDGRKRKRKFRPLRFVFTLVLLTAIITLLALSSICNITGIEVRGCSHYKKEDIIGATNLAIGNNAFKTMGNNIDSILKFRYISAERNIRNSLPYVKDATVKYIIPGKVIITITEREPKYVVLSETSSLLMDSEGYLIDALNEAKDINLTVVRGLKFEKLEIGQALKHQDKESLKIVEKLKEAMVESDSIDNFKFLPILNYIDVSDFRKISIKIDSRIIINFGDMLDIDYKLHFAKYLYQKNIEKKERGILDFSFGENPRFIPEN